MVDSQYTYGWTEDRPGSCNYITPAVVKLLKGMGASRVLDIGSGNGELCQTLHQEMAIDAVGIEYDADGCRIAREKFPNIPFYNVSVYDDPSGLLEKEKPFDVVVSTEVIEHLFYPAELVRFSASVSVPGARLILTTPYHGYLKNLALSLTNMWDHHLDPLWDGGHIKFWSRKTITALLERNGYEVEWFGGVGRVRWLWMSMVVVARRKSA